MTASPRQAIPLEDVPAAAPSDWREAARHVARMSGDELFLLRGVLPAGHPLEVCVRSGLRREAHAMERLAEAREAARRARAEAREELRRWASDMPIRGRARPDQRRATSRGKHGGVRPGSGPRARILRDKESGQTFHGLKRAAAFAGVSDTTVSHWVKAGHRFEVVGKVAKRSEAA